MELRRSLLQVCENGANKTKMVYQTDMNFKSAESHIGVLIEAGDVVYDGHKYTITDRGKKALALSGKLAKEFPELSQVR
jgi:predicted transcriptional regulator